MKAIYTNKLGQKTEVNVIEYVQEGTKKLAKIEFSEDAKHIYTVFADQITA